MPTLHLVISIRCTLRETCVKAVSLNTSSMKLSSVCLVVARVLE